MSNVDILEFLAGNIDDAEHEAEAGRRMSVGNPYTVIGYKRFHNEGFTATLATELEAYKLALDWRHYDEVAVKETTVGTWNVSCRKTEPGT